MTDTSIEHRLLRIVAIENAAPDVKVLSLEAEDGNPIPYKAGQYLTLAFHHFDSEERRSYSIV